MFHESFTLLNGRRRQLRNIENNINTKITQSGNINVFGSNASQLRIGRDCDIENFTRDTEIENWMKLKFGFEFEFGFGLEESGMVVIERGWRI